MSDTPALDALAAESAVNRVLTDIAASLLGITGGDVASVVAALRALADHVERHGAELHQIAEARRAAAGIK